MEHYSPGDTVLVNDFKYISALLDEFCPSLDCIKPLSIEQIASKYAQIVDVINAPGGNPEFDYFAVLMLENGQDFVLPLQGFQPVKIEVQDSDDEKIVDPYEQQLRRTSTLSQENVIVYHMAAEIIQSAYRRYRECKKYIQKRRVLSFEQEVLNLAAETISRNLKKIIKKAKAKQSMLNNNKQKPIEVLPQAQPMKSQPQSTKLQLPEPQSTKPQPTKPPSTGSRTGALALVLGNIRVENIPNVAWNEENSPYVLIESFDWHYKTDTKYSSGKRGNWGGDICAIKVVNNNDQHLKFYIYHECLAIQDKLIGVCEISLATLQQQHHHQSDPKNNSDYTCSLYDSMNVIKRKARGSFSFQFRLSPVPPTKSNWEPRTKEDFNRLSSLEGSTVSTKYVDCNGSNIQSINGISASKVLAAATTLDRCESETDPSIDNIIPISSRTIPSLEQDSLRLDKSRFKNQHDDSDLDDYYSEEQNILSPYATSRMSNISEEIIHMEDTASFSQQKSHSDDRGISIPSPTTTAPSTDLHPATRPLKKIRTMSTISSSSFMKRDDMSQRLPNMSSAVSRAYPKIVPQETIISYQLKHDIVYVFDELFYMVLTKYCGTISLTIQEFIILLDSIDVPIHAKYLHYALLPSTSPMDSKISRLFSTMVSLVINHPNAFAATVKDILIQHSYLLMGDEEDISSKRGDDQDLRSHLFVTPQKATSAIDTMVKLIKGDYDNIRGMIFLACRNGHLEGDDAEVYGNYSMLSTQKRPLSTTATNKSKTMKSTLKRKLNQDKTATVHPMMMNMVRPKHFGKSSVRKIVQMMNIHPLNESIHDTSPGSSEVHLSPTSTISITSGTISTGKIDGKPQMTGMDLLNITKEDLLRNYHIQSSLLRIRFCLYQETLQMVESFWDSGVRPNDHVQGNKQAASSSLTKMKSKYAITSNTTNVQPSESGSLQDYQLADANAVFNCYMPLNRAYGWGISLSHLTTLSNHIGNFQCRSTVAEFLPSREFPSSSSSSRMANEFDELIWVKMEFPSQEVKLSAIRALQSCLNELNHTLVKLSSIDGIPEIDERKENTDSLELFVNVPKSCCRKVDKRSWLSHQSSNSVNPEELQVGGILRVISSQERLCRLCEQYEWWDRPSLVMLGYFANQYVEIISTNEVMTKQRVGVKLIPSKKQRKEFSASLEVNISNVCDALPVQAFLRYDPTDEKQFGEFQKLTSFNNTSSISQSGVLSSEQTLTKRKLGKEKSSTRARNMEERNGTMYSVDEEQLYSEDQSDASERGMKRKTQKKKKRKKKSVPATTIKASDGEEKKLETKTMQKSLELSSDENEKLPKDVVSVSAPVVQVQEKQQQRDPNRPKTRMKSREQVVEKKDYSWLNPSQEPFQALLEDDFANLKLNAKTNENQQAIRQQLRGHQAELDLSQAVYTPGMLPQAPPAVSPTNRNTKRKVPLVVVSRKDKDETKQYHDNGYVDFEMKGFGYDEEGKVKAEPTTFVINEDVITAKSKKAKKVKPTNHDIEVTEQPLPYSSVVDAPPSSSKRLTNQSLRVINIGEQDIELQSIDENDDTADRNIEFKVEVATKATSPPKLKNHKKKLKEALLFEKEMTKTAKEFQKKEHQILRELKKLGIDLKATHQENDD